MAEEETPTEQEHTEEQREEVQEQPEEDQTAQLTDKLLRLQAEFDNFRRRTREEQQLMRTHATRDVLLDMLQVHDLLTLALTQNEGSELHTGVQMILEQFTQTLEKYGMRPVQTETFDPALHEAVSTQSNEQSQGTIISVVQPGYTLNDVIVRTAKVIVSAGPDGGTQND